MPRKRSYPAATAVPEGAAKRECTRACCATSGSRNNADAKDEMPAARRTAPGGCKKHATLQVRVRTACPQCQCLSIKRLLAVLLGRTRALRPLLAGSGTDTTLFSVVQAESALRRAACSYIPFLRKHPKTIDSWTSQDWRILSSP